MPLDISLSEYGKEPQELASSDENIYMLFIALIGRSLLTISRRSHREK